MKLRRRMYIEQKNNGKEFLNDSGPAIIGEVSYSKTGITIYFENKTFQRIKGGGIWGNYYCLEDGNEYWISGVKKHGSNRHIFGSGPIEEK